MLCRAVQVGAFPRYLASAGAASCVDIAVVQILLGSGFAGSATLYAAAIAFGALGGMTVNFLISRRFVFAIDDRATHEQLVSFAVISLSTLALRLLVAFLLVELFTLPLFSWSAQFPIEAAPQRAAHLGAVGLVVLYSFFAHKHVSFAGGVLAFLANKATVRP